VPPLKPKLRFTLTSTSGSRKSHRISPQLKVAFKEVIRDICKVELPEIEGVSLGIVCMTDDELLELNRSALDHDYYTDILTFEIERTEQDLEAELYFSVDRAIQNAKKYRVSADYELLHLCVHGVLHLAGYDDHGELNKKRMVNRERFFLRKYKDTFR